MGKGIATYQYGVLAEILGLPADIRIVDVNVPADRYRVVELGLESTRFPDHGEGDMLPRVNVVYGQAEGRPQFKYVEVY